MILCSIGRLIYVVIPAQDLSRYQLYNWFCAVTAAALS